MLSVINFIGGCYDTVKRNLISLLETKYSQNFEDRYNQWFKNDDYLFNKKSKFKIKINDKQEYKYIPMPPPNITGKLHMGHALFLIIQDSLCRYYKAIGHTCLWLPGLDHGGIATHEKIIKEQNDKNISYEEAAKNILKNKDIILNQMKKLGAMPDWSMLTYTLDDKYKSFALKILKLLFDDKKIFFKDNQYYINMNSLAFELNDDIKNNIINIIPEKEKGKLTHMLDNIEPWCISRQIPWGTKLPMKINEKNEIIWDDNETSQSMDIWFNSSFWPLASLLNNLDKHPNLLKNFYPASILETGSDILFPWCARMLMMGNYIYKNQKILNLKINSKYPFYHIYLHGIIRDKNNIKFSKSLGNGIDPLELLKDFSPDAIRLFLISRTGPAQDIKFNINELSGTSKFINKIYQGARFISIYANKFEIEKLDENYEINNDNLNIITNNFCKYMDEFNFLEASRFIQKEYKSWFCDIWIEENKHLIQSGDINTLKDGLFILKKLLSMLQIFCPYICDEIYDKLYN